MIKVTYKRIALLGASALGLAATFAAPAQAIDLREAVAAALRNNPEINQAAANRQAVEEERRQAQGLYGPRVTVEGSAGRAGTCPACGAGGASTRGSLIAITSRASAR